jgi:hypothetical protein
MSEKLTEALQLYDKGQFGRALSLLEECKAQSSTAEIAEHIRSCQKMLARKFWRQGKTEEFVKMMHAMGAENSLALAAARLCGKEAMMALAQKNEGVLSKLAGFSISDDIKQGLLAMRKEPELKLIAEGWLSLLKKDTKRSIESFQAADGMQVGLGVAYLMQGDRESALKHLQKLRPFASRFPAVSSAMGWDVPLQEDQKLLFRYLFQLSFQELQEIERKLHPYQKKIKAWVHLRLGDYYSLSSAEKALGFWAQAANALPLLRLDVLKRRYLLSFSPESELVFKDEFFDFYRELRKARDQDARAFVEHLVLSLDRPLHLDSEDLRRKGGKWIFSSPPVELQLLWLHLIYKEQLSKLEKLIFFTQEKAEEEIGFCLEDWDKLFLELDAPYGKQEKYLRYKLSVAKLFFHSDWIRETIIKLLMLNAHLKQELIPLYFKEAIKDVFGGSQEKLVILRQEISSLRHYFPTDFDLMYLSVLINPEESISNFSKQLSEPLFAVLQFQVAMSQRKPAVDCKKLIPGAHLRGKSREADCCLLTAIFDFRGHLFEKEIENWTRALAPDAETQHAFFLYLERYGKTAPLSVLKKWIRKDKKDWRARYHLALYYALQGNEDQCLEMLCTAEVLMPLEAPQRDSIINTLAFYWG